MTERSIHCKGMRHPDHPNHDKYLARERARRARRREAAAAAKTCILCLHRRAVKGSTYCAPCIIKQSEVVRRIYLERIGAGKCGISGCERVPSFRYPGVRYVACDYHRQLQRNYNLTARTRKAA